ncbi:MAG TPA: ROK family protein, partial [Propionibacteriaceae bacterium]|nr:ROK family protein [Propionibacteriaceae bacterium]
GELARLVESLVEQAASGPLGGLVAILPGELDEHDGTVDFPVFGWDRVPATRWLHEQLNVPVELVGPPRASAVTCIADGLCPEGRGLMVYFGYGVSVSIIEDWKAVAPSLGGGELGHCTIPGTTGVCSCGRTGCLGLSASGAAIARDLAARDRAEYADLPLRELSELADPVVDDVLAGVAHSLGLGISWLLNITGSRPVVIGGSPYAAGADAFRAMVAEVVKESVPRHLAEALTVVGCREDSSTTGAIQMALHLLPTHLRPPAHRPSR